MSVEDLALRLRHAADSGVPIAPIRDEVADIEMAYAIQAANTEHALRSGRRLVGRKIGLTSAVVQRQLGVDQPDFGALFADMCFTDGEAVPVDRIVQPRAEVEIALVLSADIDHEWPTVVDVIGAVAYALPAIELVGSRIADWDIQITDTVADNASSGLFVLGTQPVALNAFDHRLCGMVMEIDGVESSLGAGAACLGNPMNAALWLARKMTAIGTPLAAGDVVMTGALGPMAPVRTGQIVEGRIEGLGVVRADLVGGLS